MDYLFELNIFNHKFLIKSRPAHKPAQVDSPMGFMFDENLPWIIYLAAICRYIPCSLCCALPYCNIHSEMQAHSSSGLSSFFDAIANKGLTSGNESHSVYNACFVGRYRDNRALWVWVRARVNAIDQWGSIIVCTFDNCLRLWDCVW